MANPKNGGRGMPAGIGSVVAELHGVAAWRYDYRRSQAQCCGKYHCKFGNARRLRE